MGPPPMPPVVWHSDGTRRHRVLNCIQCNKSFLWPPPMGSGPKAAISTHKLFYYKLDKCNYGIYEVLKYVFQLTKEQIPAPVEDHISETRLICSLCWTSLEQLHRAMYAFHRRRSPNAYLSKIPTLEELYKEKHQQQESLASASQQQQIGVKVSTGFTTPMVTSDPRLWQSHLWPFDLTPTGCEGYAPVSFISASQKPNNLPEISSRSLKQNTNMIVTSSGVTPFNQNAISNIIVINPSSQTPMMTPAPTMLKAMRNTAVQTNSAVKARTPVRQVCLSFDKCARQRITFYNYVAHKLRHECKVLAKETKLLRYRYIKDCSGLESLPDIDDIAKELRQYCPFLSVVLEEILIPRRFKEEGFPAELTVVLCCIIQTHNASMTSILGHYVGRLMHRSRDNFNLAQVVDSLYKIGVSCCYKTVVRAFREENKAQAEGQGSSETSNGCPMDMDVDHNYSRFLMERDDNPGTPGDSTMQAEVEDDPDEILDDEKLQILLEEYSAEMKLRLTDDNDDIHNITTVEDYAVNDLWK